MGGEETEIAGVGTSNGSPMVEGCVAGGAAGGSDGGEGGIFGGSEGRGSLRMRMGGFSKELAPIALMDVVGETVSIWLKVRFGPEVWTFSPTRRNRRKIILLVLP